MDDRSKTLRAAVLEHITLLARASLQTQYEKDVPAANVPAELICGFCDDLFHPKSRIFLDAFSAQEVRELAILYGLLHVASRKIGEVAPLQVTDLQRLPEWRSVMAYAKELEADFGTP